MTTNSQLGIIKGNAYHQEESIDAINREVYEEVGLIVPKERWNTLISIPHPLRPSRIYFLAVTPEERLAIETHIEERRKRHCGELFQIGFRDLRTTDLPMNHLTRRICEWLMKQILPGLEDIPTQTLTFSPLIDIDHKELTYTIDRIEEPPFVWGKKRRSLLPIPL